MSRPARPEEVQRALLAIDAVIPIEHRLVLQPRRFVADDHKDELFVWVYEREPSSFATGEVYGTVFIRFTPGREPHVAQFRSRRRADGGDDTIP